MNGRTASVRALVLLLVGCGTVSHRNAPNAEAAVRRAADAWAAAAAAKDGHAMGRFFADDAFVMYPQPAPTIGREANREAWVKFFARPNAEHPFGPYTVVVSAAGDMAYILGRGAWSYDGPAGRVSRGGWYLAVWRLIADEWQIVALSAHRHDPPPAFGGDVAR